MAVRLAFRSANVLAISILLAARQQAAAQSSCSMRLVGQRFDPEASALAKSIKSVNVSCSGDPVAFQGVPAMTGFGAAFAGEAPFTFCASVAMRSSPAFLQRWGRSHSHMGMHEPLDRPVGLS